MKNKKRIGYYLVAWAALTAYLYLDNWVNTRGTQPYVWSNLAALFISFTFCFFVAYPLFLKRKTIIPLLGSLLVAVGLFICSRYLIEEKLFLWMLGYGNYDPDVKWQHYVQDNWWRGLKPVLFSFVAWSLIEIFKREREAELLKKERIQAELLFLKTQVNPHFLYNTLNYMYAMAYPLSEELREAIIRLSQLMRYILHSSPKEMIDLQQEIDYLQHYIGIYRLRYQEHFFVEFKVDGESSGKQIAPLIFVSFVENALKHGTLNDPDVPILINLKINADQLIFEVSNQISYGEKDITSGIGLPNIRRRLELLYPGKHRLSILDNEKTYTTILELSLN